MSDERLPMPTRRAVFGPHTDAFARPLEPGEALEVVNDSGRPCWLYVTAGRDGALGELSRVSRRLGTLVGAVEATADRLDYLQGLWGKEAVTDRMAATLRAALADGRAVEQGLEPPPED